MTHADHPSSVTLRLLILALALQGLSGVVGGIGLITDPNGASLDIPLEWLAGSPFSDYSLPGMVLLTVLGIGPLVVVWGLWAGRSWSTPGSLLVGVALLVWIGVEVAVIGYQADPPLQLIYGVLGLAIVVLSLAGSVRGAPFGGWKHERNRDGPGTIPTA